MNIHSPSHREQIRSSHAPPAIGPYSQAVLAGDTLWCSGQIALDPETGRLIDGDVQDETARALDNLGAVLAAAGMDYRHVVRCTVYLARMDDYALVNEVYARYFSEAPPSREAVQAAALPRNAKVEISCVAVR
jgi:2-iminobutanoate/2-iminopropanoate deaminase